MTMINPTRGEIVRHQMNAPLNQESAPPTNPPTTDPVVAPQSSNSSAPSTFEQYLPILIVGGVAIAFYYVIK